MISSEREREREREQLCIAYREDACHLSSTSGGMGPMKDSNQKPLPT